MNFSDQTPHSAGKAMRIAIVMTLHAIALMLGLSVQHRITVHEPIDPIPIKQLPKEPPRPIEPEPPIPEHKLPSSALPSSIIDLPPMDIQVPRKDDGTTIKGSADVGDVKTGGGGGGIVAPHAEPIHVAAVVDPNACEKPEYPPISARNGETGTVVLSMLIGVDGRVRDANIEKSSGYKSLDRAARNALSLCKFKPGTTDGVPEQSWTKIQYAWSLN